MANGEERGLLVLCATPIGNLSDVSERLREVLESADVVYAEDTRRSRVLLDALGVSTPLRSYFVGNEEARAVEVAQHLEGGETVALLTDAGTPAVADPGLSAVRAAVEVGASVSTVPGPSAVTAALAVSGLPSERFVFEGFLPRKGKERTTRLSALAAESRTIVLFSAPSRVGADLEDLRDHLGAERPVVVARELTKLHEEVWRGTLREACDHWDEARRRGEFTLVVGGREEQAPSLDEAVAEVATLTAAGVPAAAAVRIVAERRGMSRRRLYEAVHRPGDGELA
jgi:16S rRNA (cytidine1402-2'-O)-methyltransferase